MPKIQKQVPTEVRPVELAEFVGLSTRRIAQLEKEGRITKAATGRYPFKESVREILSRNQDKLDGGAERARKDSAAANKLELEVAKLDGTLVETLTVQEVWADLITGAKTRLLAIPHKLSPLVSNETNAETNRDTIETEIHAALFELAGGEQAGDFDVGNSSMETTASPHH